MYNKLSPIYVIFAAVLWGVDGIVLTPQLYTLPVALVVFINSLFVTVLFVPIAIKNRFIIKNLTIRDLIPFILVAVFGGALGTMTITKALFYVNYVNLSIVMLIQKLQPLFAILLAAIILKERLPGRFFIWAGIALVGTYLMTFGLKTPVLETGDKTLLAALFAFIAAISFGSSTVFSKKALKNTGFEVGTYLRFALTTLLLLPIIFINGSFIETSNITNHQLMIFALIAITTGAPAIFLYYYGLKKISASVSTICELAFPLTAVILEYFLRDNILNAVQFAGVILLISSIYKVTKLNLKT